MNAVPAVQIPYQKSSFSKLRVYYLLALSTIAISIIIGQVLVQLHLRRQESDARVINFAGRQRMLSQQISKIALKIQTQPLAVNQQIIAELKSANEEWQKNNNNLKNAKDSVSLPLLTDAQIKLLFAKNDIVFHKIWQASTELYNALITEPHQEISVRKSHIESILNNEQSFLVNMEAIVDRLEYLAAEKVTQLKHTEYLLFTISLAIILLEVIFIFLPTTKNVNETLLKLIKSENDATQMSKEIGALYASLEASYERISGITLPVASPKLIAKADRGANLIYVTESYRKDFFVQNQQHRATIAHLFNFEGDMANDFNDQLIDVVANGKNWHNELTYTDNRGNRRYMDIFVIPVYEENAEAPGLSVMAADLTPRRLAEQDMHKRGRAEIEKKINEQKFRSVLVLEGQEEERKRIAMNIHDGIGQLLTSLKFHISSIDLRKPAEAATKLEDINALTRRVIQEVRRVTFNLKPPVLSDYGLVAGLKNLVQEIDRLSDEQVIFENHGNFNQRLSSKVENNIYRIVQEAINNAIKYAHSDKVEVIIAHEQEELSVMVKDYGVGFEHKQLAIFHVDYGHGFLNMQERAAYINGRLTIESEKGVGTIIKLFVPLVTKPEDT